MTRQKPVRLLTVAVLGAMLLGRVPADSAPASRGRVPGDSPDVQVFVTFRSAAGGYELQVPQGWARITRGSDVRFTSALEGVEVVVRPAATAPTAASVRPREAAAMAKAGRSVRITNVRDVQLPGGHAVLVEYTSTSTPDAVTGKSMRLQNNAYLFFKRGTAATLTVSAPAGTDNVDEWQYMARSFRWL